jgi:hypothetical protein
VLNEDEKKTQEYVYHVKTHLRVAHTVCLTRYDKLAFRYVSYAAIPLLAAYTIYSLLYETHKGWYSFVISTLTSFVYMFGFVRNFLMVLVPRLMTLAGSTDPTTDHQLQAEGRNRHRLCCNSVAYCAM